MKKNTLILLAVVLGSGVLFTAAQQNTFCSANVPCSLSAKWTFNESTVGGPVAALNIVPGTLPNSVLATGDIALDSGASNNLKIYNGASWDIYGKLPINLAGGAGVVTGVLPGANMAATNLAGGNNPGGVTGVLPVGNEGSGTPAASKYVDGGTGAWTALPASVTEATMANQAAGPLGTTGTCGTTGSFIHCTDYILPNAHTLVRFIVFVYVAPVGCSTAAVFAVRDITSSTNLTTLSPTITGVADSGALSVAMTAGHTFGIGLTTTPAGCSTFINSGQTAVYQ
jgi:hypothetical protein